MNIKEIKKVVNSGESEEMQRRLILHIIARDKKAIPDIMEMLAIERKDNSELIRDMNHELSRTHIFIEGLPEEKPKKKDEKEGFSRKFVLGEIEKFYSTYRTRVTHCFNRFKQFQS